MGEIGNPQRRVEVVPEVPAVRPAPAPPAPATPAKEPVKEPVPV